MKKKSGDFTTSIHGIPGEQQPEYCHQCGKCSSCCPVADFLDFRPRRIVAMVQLEMIEELLKSDVIWECTHCLACKERCPRDVAPYDVIQALQNLAYSRSLPYPQGYRMLVNSILKDGVISEPTKVKVWKNLPTKETGTQDFEYLDRSSLNLPPFKNPAEMEKFAQALKKALMEE